MSGTSLDGIDAALIETDGEAQVRALAFRGEPFSDAARAQLAEATALALAFERCRFDEGGHALRVVGIGLTVPKALAPR